MKKSLTCFAIVLIAAGCCNAPLKQEPLKVAAIFATPLAEPWDAVVHQALLAAEKEGEITYDYSDNVRPEQFEEKLRSIAGQNYDIIFGDAFANEATVRDVAGDFPLVKFVFGSGLGPSAPNLSVFDNWIHEPAYLAGLIAGHLTRSGNVGVVGAFDIPEVNRLINAFKTGVLEINPGARVRIVFIDAWYDPAAASAAAKALIAEGSDVMYAERDGVISACNDAGIPVIGNLSDQHSGSPGNVVTSVLWNMKPTVNRVIRLVRSGHFEPEDYAGWSFMAKGGAELAPYREWEPKLDPEIREIIARRTQEIITGRFRVPLTESRPLSE